MKKKPRPDVFLDASIASSMAGPWSSVITPVVPPATQGRPWAAHPETMLWMRVVEDARDTAVRLGKGLSLPGASQRPGVWRADHAANMTELRDWLGLCPECHNYPGSLPWIAAVLSSTTGATPDAEAAWVEAVRKFVLKALETGAGAQHIDVVRKRKRRARIVGK